MSDLIAVPLCNSMTFLSDNLINQSKGHGRQSVSPRSVHPQPTHIKMYYHLPKTQQSQGADEWVSERTEGLNFAVASLFIATMILIIVTGLALAKPLKGKPPQHYCQMMENYAPSLLLPTAPKHYIAANLGGTGKSQQSLRKFDRLIAASTVFLVAAQLLKLALLLCLSYSLEQEEKSDMVSYTQLFEIASLGALLGAYICETYFWVKTYTSVSTQALQLGPIGLLKKLKGRKECIICYGCFVAITFIMVSFVTDKMQVSHDSGDSTVKEISSIILLDQTNGFVISAFFLAQAIAMALIPYLSARVLFKSYRKRYHQFSSKLVSCATWLSLGCFMVGLRFGFQSALRGPLIDRLMTDMMTGEGSTAFIVYYAVASVLSELLAYVALLVAINRRHKVWLNRLNIFPLGMPDGVEVPVQANLLAQLKEEIAQTGFAEYLLDESDLMSLVKARRDGLLSEEDLPFSEDTTSNYNTNQRKSLRYISILRQRQVGNGSPYAKTNFFRSEILYRQSAAQERPCSSLIDQAGKLPFLDASAESNNTLIAATAAAYDRGTRVNGTDTADEIGANDQSNSGDFIAQTTGTPVVNGGPLKARSLIKRVSQSVVYRPPMSDTTSVGDAKPTALIKGQKNFRGEVVMRQDDSFDVATKNSGDTTPQIVVMDDASSAMSNGDASRGGCGKVYSAHQGRATYGTRSKQSAFATMQFEQDEAESPDSEEHQLGDAKSNDHQPWLKPSLPTDDLMEQPSGQTICKSYDELHLNANRHHSGTFRRS